MRSPLPRWLPLRRTMRRKAARVLKMMLCALLVFGLFPGSDELVETVVHLVHDGHLPHSETHDLVAATEDCGDSDEHGCTAERDEQPLQRRHVGIERRDRRHAAEQRENMRCLQRENGLRADRRGKPLGLGEGLGLRGREIHGEKIALALHCEPAAQRLELDLWRPMPQMGKEHMRACKRGMAAKRHLDGGREPAQTEAFTFRHEESRLGEIVLSRDRLHERVVRPAFERNDARGIALEGPVCKGINLKNRGSHDRIRQASVEARNLRPFRRFG